MTWSTRKPFYLSIWAFLQLKYNHICTKTDQNCSTRSADSGQIIHFCISSFYWTCYYNINNYTRCNSPKASVEDISAQWAILLNDWLYGSLPYHTASMTQSFIPEGPSESQWPLVSDGVVLNIWWWKTVSISLSVIGLTEQIDGQLIYFQSMLSYTYLNHIYGHNLPKNGIFQPTWMIYCFILVNKTPGPDISTLQHSLYFTLTSWALTQP